MKLTKRGIVASVLAVCLVLTAIPAFAIEMVIPGSSIIPAEGLPISIQALGWTGSKLRIVLSEESAKLLEVNGNSASNVYAGVTLSANFHYKNVDGDANETTSGGSLKYRNENGDKYLEDFTVVDMPIVSTTPNGNNTAYCLEATSGDFRNASPEMKAAFDAYVQGEGMASNSTTLYFNTNDATSGYEITNVVLKVGSWDGAQDTIVNTLDFPEGTMFISASNFVDAPTGWTRKTSDNYTYYQKTNDSAPNGPYVAFKAKESGTYALWGFIKNRIDGTDRYPRFIFNNGTTMVFSTTNATTGTTSDSFGPERWYWEPAKDNVTMDLKAGETVVLQLSSSSNKNTHFAAIAFVPVEAGFTLTTEQAQSEEYRFQRTAFEVLQELTTDEVQMESGEAVSVIVNGEAVSAKPGSARSAGAGVNALDLANNFITKATVIDAVAAAKVNVSGYKNGYLRTKIGATEMESVVTDITLNGEKVLYPDLIYVKEGDVITTSAVPETVDKTSFAPINAGTARNTEGSLTVNNKACIKYCMNASALPAFAKTTADTGLTDCFINGYIVTKKEYQGTPAGSKIYFKNVKVLKIAAAGTRIDVAIDLSSCDGKVASQIALTDENGTVYHDPYRYVIQKVDVYDFSNLWLTNAKTEGGIKVFDNGDHYVLTTDAAETCYIVRATYDENGALVSTDTEEVFVTMANPVAIKAEDNQKVFVWKNEPFKGTTMQPLCAPLAK